MSQAHATQRLNRLSLVRLSPPTFYHKRQEQGSWWFQSLRRNFLSGTLMGVRELSVSCVTTGSTVAKFLPPSSKASSPLPSSDAFLRALPTASSRPLNLGPGIRSQNPASRVSASCPSTKCCSSSLLLWNKSLQRVACGTSTADCGHGVCGSDALEGGAGCCSGEGGQVQARVNREPTWLDVPGGSLGLEGDAGGGLRACVVCYWSVCRDAGSMRLGLTARWLSSQRGRPEQKQRLGVSEPRDRGGGCSLSSLAWGSSPIASADSWVGVRPAASPKHFPGIVPILIHLCSSQQLSFPQGSLLGSSMVYPASPLCQP